VRAALRIANGKSGGRAVAFGGLFLAAELGVKIAADKLKEWMGVERAEGGVRRLFIGRYIRRWRADGPFLPPITIIRAYSVHTGWDATARANGGCSVINTAVRARVVWVRRDRRQTGDALHWKN